MLRYYNTNHKTMRALKTDKYYLFFKTNNANIYFIHTIRICKIPEKTKEYKVLREMLNSGKVESCGYCTDKYYQENKYEFITNYI